MLLLQNPAILAGHLIFLHIASFQTSPWTNLDDECEKQISEFQIDINVRLSEVAKERAQEHCLNDKFQLIQTKNNIYCRKVSDYSYDIYVESNNQITCK